MKINNIKIIILFKKKKKKLVYLVYLYIFFHYFIKYKFCSFLKNLFLKLKKKKSFL